MENNLDKEMSDGITIVMDKPYFKSGSEMTGKIYIQLSQQFPATSLILKLVGSGSSYFYQYNYYAHHIDPHHKLIKDSMLEYMGKLFQWSC